MTRQLYIRKTVRTRFVCKYCTVSVKETTLKNFDKSNWCKKCANWKPKEQLLCECCGSKCRYRARGRIRDNEKRI